MSSQRSDELVSTLNSLGFYSNDCRHYTNGSMVVKRAGNELVGTTIEQLAEQLSMVTDKKVANSSASAS
jgi:hypothetical protein